MAPAIRSLCGIRISEIRSPKWSLNVLRPPASVLHMPGIRTQDTEKTNGRVSVFLFLSFVVRMYSMHDCIDGFLCFFIHRFMAEEREDLKGESKKRSGERGGGNHYTREGGRQMRQRVKRREAARTRNGERRQARPDEGDAMRPLECLSTGHSVAWQAIGQVLSHLNQRLQDGRP